MDLGGTLPAFVVNIASRDQPMILSRIKNILENDKKKSPQLFQNNNFKKSFAFEGFFFFDLLLIILLSGLKN
jgi:hypothetical protein